MSVARPEVRHFRLRTFSSLFLLFAFISPGLLAQQEDGAATANPLDELYARVKQALSTAGFPITEEQDRAIALMTEDRRQASEELFGETMDFSSGPVQGQQLDRALAAIQWMEAEFTRRLAPYLTPEQARAWASDEASRRTGSASADDGASTAPEGQTRQTQFVRINNNALSAESGFFGGRGGGGGAEVIERGGTGSFHGQVSFNLQDSALNARNAFASKKPQYQERQINSTFGGPVIPRRLTATGSFSQSEAQNADTVHATLPDGIVQLGIVRPNINRSGGVRGTYQLADRHSLIFNVRYSASTQKNNSVGGFTLPERASSNRGRNSTLELRHFAVFSDALVYEQSVRIQRNERRNLPLSEGMAINVLDAFRGGGGQDRSETSSIDYTLENLLTRSGPVWTVRAGVNGGYRTSDDFSSSNFTGTYTFSNLDDYVNGRPLTFRVTRGEPRIGVTQLELSPFIQNDLKVTQQLTLMLGVRYEYQTNLSDNNNVAPRAAFAWAAGRSLVVRGGAGVYYQRLTDSMVQTQRRLDGTRQYEIVINDPSWPDPFQSGDVTVKLPTSVRVTAPSLVAPHDLVGQVSVERTFPNNLFVSAGYERVQGVNLFRSRNLNAPLPGQTVNPDPARGQVVQLEATGRSISHTLRLTARQRFSVFNVSASYSFGNAFTDAQFWMSLPSNNYDPGADWGPSGGSRNSLTATVNARLPMGLFLTATHRWTSGLPYNITTGRDDNADGVTNDRPVGVGRNSATGPGFQSTTFNISKAIYFGDQGRSGSGTNLNWFVNLSNAFNRVNLGTPSGVMTSSNFGRSTSARNPRELEVGVRFGF
jgi:hypothetical protein